jgi:hypothetical protein
MLQNFVLLNCFHQQGLDYHYKAQLMSFWRDLSILTPIVFIFG